MSAPVRIQLSRAKGWRKPANTIVVARPSKWGNPWRVGDVIGADIDGGYTAGAVITPELAVVLYRAALLSEPLHRNIICGLEISIDDARAELAGHNLACWCPPGQPCHADVLLEVANP